MGLSKRLIDLSTRDVEEPLYDEGFRLYEDVFEAGIWPPLHCDPLNPCEACVWADEQERDEGRTATDLESLRR